MKESKEIQALPLKPMTGKNNFEIELNRVPISWDLEKGCLSFFGLDSALFWTDPSMIHMLTPLAEEVGIDLFRLLISYSSSLGTNEDYHAMVSTLGENFPDGFLAWGKAVSGAGWGTFELTHYDPDTQKATVVVHNPWELRMQRDLPKEKRWGCPFLQGKIIGIFSHAFKTPCWSEDDCYHDPNHSRVTFRIYPSSSTIQKELKKLRYQRLQFNERTLAESVEKKTTELNQAQADLEEYSTSLEQQVSERTAELEALLKKLEVEKEKLKKSNLELQQTEKERHELVEESPVAIFTTTPDGKLLHANKACQGLFGFSSIEEFQKKMVNVRDLYVHPEDRDKLVDEMMRFGKVSKKEFKYKIAEKKGWLQLSVRKKRKADDSIEFQGFAQDITAEKEALEKLEESRERLQIAFGVLNAGSWSYYPQTQIAYFSPEWFTMLGYQPDEFEHTYDTWATLVHPEDLPTVVETLQRFLESRSQDFYESEFRMLAKDGTWRWISGRGRTFEWDDNGAPLRLIGANFDITPYKETQAALEESESLFRAIFNQTYQFTGLLDKTGRLEKINQAALNFVGRNENEVLGRPFEETPWWPNRDKTRRDLKKLIEAALSGEVRRKEVVNLDKHGQGRPVDFTISPFRDENGVITHLIAEGRDITEIRAAKDRIEFEAYHDPLTGIGNRRLCIRTIRKHLQSRSTDIFCVIFLDIKQFKDINHAYGYHLGDLLLSRIAKRISAVLGNEEKGFRIGGDHFVVVETVTDREQGFSLAKKLKEALSRPFLLDGEEVTTRISFGLTFCEGEESGPEMILSRAALAHDEANKNQKEENVVYDNTLHDQYLRRITINKLIPQAMENSEFRLEYQPVVNTRTGRLFGFEALLRWDNQQFGLISPGEFIPIAEDGGHITAIGEWVVKKGLSFWKDMRMAEPGLVLSTNVSGKQFAQQGFFSHLESIIKASDVHPSLIQLEITETALMHNVQETVIKLEALRKLGVRISIDDFGTGYSSLEYLRMFSADALKIDMGFVQQLGKDNKTCGVVRAMVDLAKTFDMDVIGEGVETENQKLILRELGCYFHQGYFYSHPIRQENMRAFLEKWPT